MIKKRKLVLVGTGFVGMSMAYCFLNQGGIDELVLVDIDKQKAEGEAMDLSHGIPFSEQEIEIKSGGYEECADAAIVVITAGVAQKPNETRLDLAKTNAQIIKTITKEIVESGFSGIFVIASNPVDLMTAVVQKESGFPKEKVIGTGTVLDTARLRYSLGKYLNISTKNVHAYIMGEHGDSSFVPWTHCYAGCKSLIDIMAENSCNTKDLDRIYTEVQQAAYEIIKKKKATYYAIGLSLTKLIKAILNNENGIYTVSAYLNGEYHQKDIYIGVPAIINKNGVSEILELNLTKEEQEKFDFSANLLRKMKEKIV
jgi:L-lactate dehydrogenase